MREDGVDLRKDEGHWITKTDKYFGFYPFPFFFLLLEVFFLQNLTSTFDITSSATGTFFINRSVIYKT